MRADLKGLRHGKESVYGTLVLILGILVWAAVLALVAAIVSKGHPEKLVIAAVEIVFFVLFFYLAKLFYRAHLYGHAVLIGERQFPKLHQSIVDGAQKLGMKRVPQSFLYNSNGLMNAFAMRVAGRQMVLLTSALVDVQNDRQVDFVIGHELGHHAAGHLNPWLNTLKLPGTFIPFLGAAYHRSRELTADRIGAFCTGDFDASRSALHMLACGSARLNSAMNADAFAAQEDLVPPVTGFLLHIISGYPRLTRRVNEVDDYLRAQGGVARPISAERLIG